MAEDLSYQALAELFKRAIQTQVDTFNQQLYNTSHTDSGTFDNVIRSTYTWWRNVPPAQAYVNEVEEDIQDVNFEE